MSDSIQQLAESYISTKSQESFNQLYKRLSPGLKNHIWKYIKNHHENDHLCDDILSDTFVNAITKIDTYKKEYHFSTWIYKIATNLCINELNKNKKLFHYQSYTSDDNMELDINSLNLINKDEYTVENDFVLDDRNLQITKFFDKVKSEIEGLDDKYRDILLDREYKEMSYTDLAEKYNLNPNTLKSRLHYGRLKLSKKLEDDYKKYKEEILDNN